MNPLALLNPRGLRGFLFGAILLSTLWVTSLTLLSTRDNATALLTEAGVHVLNPFLVGRGLGLSQSGYASLEAQARAHPNQPVALSVLTVRVLGREITGHSYADVVQLVYGRVAGGYYTGGPSAVFSLPAELKQALPAFALFGGSNNLPALPGTSTPIQLPTFLQPFFTFVGLTPATFTADGHARLAALLPVFWIAMAVLGALAVVLNRSGQRLSTLVNGVVHSTWPVVLVLVGLLVLSSIYKATLGPYVGILGVVSRAFLPVYGTALVLGLLALAATRFLPALRGQPAQRQPVPVGAPMPGFTMPPGFNMPAGFPRGSDAGAAGMPFFPSASPAGPQPDAPPYAPPAPPPYAPPSPPADVPPAAGPQG
jgi:hypothetical protein